MVSDSYVLLLICNTTVPGTRYVLLCVVALGSVGYTVVSKVAIEFSMTSIVPSAFGPPFPLASHIFFFSDAVYVTA